jgi:hypothetical protein
MAKDGIFKEEKRKQVEPIFRDEHESMEEIEAEALAFGDKFHRESSVSEQADHTFAETFRQESGIRTLPELSFERPKEELVEPVLDNSGSKKERREKRKEREAKFRREMDEYEHAKAKRDYESSFFETASATVTATIAKDRIDDVYDLQNTEILSEDGKEAETPYSWIKMKFTGDDYGSYEDTPEGEQQKAEDDAAFGVQERIAKSMTEARDIIARERGKETPDPDRLKVYNSLSGRLALISNSYVLNEREIKTLRKINQDKAAILTASLKYGSASPDSPTAERYDELLDAVIKQRDQVQKILRQNLQLEIRKLTSLLRRAELVTTDDSTWADGDDLTYLEQIGVSSAIFNMLGWPYEVRRGDMTKAEAEAKYGHIFDREEDKDIRDAKRKEHDELILKELGAEYDRTAGSTLKKEGVASAEAQAYAAEETKDETATEGKKEIDLIAKEMDAGLRAAIDRIEKIMKSPEKELSAKERIDYMMALDTALTKIRQSREKLSVDKAADDTVPEEKRETEDELRGQRIAAYEARIAQLEALQEGYSLAKYNRAIRRRTNNDRILVRSARQIDTKRLDKVTLTKAERDELIDALGGSAPITAEQRTKLSTNFGAFLTKGMQSQIAGSLKALGRDEGIDISAEDRAVLHSAAHYILTFEDKEKLEPEFAKASAGTLKLLQGSLEKLKRTDATDELPEDKKKALAFTIGEKLFWLKTEAGQVLRQEELDTFESELKAITESYVSFVAEVITGEDIQNPVLSKLLTESELHPGILQEYQKLDETAKKKFISDIEASSSDAVKAIERLTINRPDLDGVSLILKAKALQGVFTDNPVALTPESAASLSASHDGARITRAVREIARQKARMSLKGKANAPALAKRLEEIDTLEDKALIAGMLKETPNAEYSFTLINAYALLYSGETGMPISATQKEGSISAESLKTLDAFKSVDVDTIRDAITSKVGSASQYVDAQVLLLSEASVYDSESLGNRFKNYFGNKLGRELSRERMGLWVLNSIVEKSGRYDAQELQRRMVRKTMGTQQAADIDLTSSAQLTTMIGMIGKSSRPAALPDYGHELTIAGRRLLSKDRLEKNRRGRRSAEHQQYSEEMRKGLGSVVDAREKRRKPDDKSVKAETKISRVSGVAFGVLSTDALMTQMEKFLEQKDDAAKLGDEFKGYRDTAEEIRKTVGSTTQDGMKADRFDLGAMTADAERHDSKSETVYKQRHLFKKSLDDLRSAKTVKEAKAALKIYTSLRAELDLVNRARAALLMEMESGHGFVDGSGRDTKTEMEKTLEAYNASFRGGLASGLTDIKAELVKTYQSAEEARTLAEAELTPEDLLLNAREDRISYYGGTAGKNVIGATFSIVVLAIGDLTSDVISKTGGADGASVTLLPKEVADYKRYFAGLRGRLGTYFNLEAMTEESITNRQKGSRVQAVRENYKRLIDAFGDVKDDDIDGLRAAAEELKRFYDENRLEDRAGAAVSMKETSSDFDRKLDDATGTREKEKSSILLAMRTRLKEKHSATLAADAVDVRDPLKGMSSNLKKRLTDVTQVAVLAAFRNAAGAPDFNAYMKRLKDDKSEEYSELVRRLAIAFTDVQFIKKDKLDAAVGSDGRYAPLGLRAGEADDEPSLAGTLMAGFMLGEFSDKVAKEAKAWKKDANGWLAGMAQRGMAESSVNLEILEKHIGKEAAAVYKEELVVGTAVDKLTSIVGKGQVLSVKNYSGGSAGAKFIVSELEVGIDIAGVIADDLTIIRDAEGNLSAYIGGSLYGQIAGSVGADLGGLVSLTGSAEVSMTLAQGIKLDFSDDDKLKSFLVRFFNGGSSSADDSELDEAARSRAMLQQADRFTPITSIDGKLGVGASVSTSESAQYTITEAVKSLLGDVDLISKASEFVSETVTPVTDFVQDKLSGIGDTVSGWAQSTVEYFGSDFMDTIKGLISVVPATLTSGTIIAEIGVALDALTDASDEVLKKYVADKIKGLPSFVADKIYDKAKEKFAAMLVKELDFKKESEGVAPQETIEKLTGMIGEKLKTLSQDTIADKIDHAFLTDDEIAAVAKEAEESAAKAGNLIDATLAAKMSIAGARKSERGIDTEKITTSVQLDASVESGLTIVGAELSKKAEGRFEAILERRFTGGKLTGATMSRRYVMAKSDAKRAKEILEGFGIHNEAILSDLRGDLAGLEGIVLVFDAELTKDGLDKYQKAREEGSGLKDLFLLNDRRNYESTAVRLEVPVNKESQQASLATSLKLKPMGTGGSVKLGYKSGADAELRQTYQYNARNA